MKFEQANGFNADLPTVELSADLDWMLQSQQVSNLSLAEALVSAHFKPLLRFTYAIFSTISGNQEAFNRVVDGLSWVVHHRDTYWGGASVTVWLYAKYLHQLRRTKVGRQWSKSGLRLLLCDLVGLSSLEADAVLANRRAASQSISADDLASRRLAFARRNVPEDEQVLIQQAVDADRSDSTEIKAFVIPSEQDIVRLVVETSSQAGMGRVFSRGLLQAVMLGTIVLALVIFVLYRTTIEEEISARITPSFAVKLVTWTPEPAALMALESTATALAHEIQELEQAWTTLPQPLTLTDLTGSNAEEYFKPDYSGLLALAAVSRYWNVSVNMEQLRQDLQPDPGDDVVMFYELSDYAISQRLEVDFRLGGTVDLLCKLIDAGFPVIIQISNRLDEEIWQAHYVIISGYDSTRQVFMVDLLGLPLISTPQRSTSDMLRGEISFREVEQRWYPFANAFLVVYRNNDPRANIEAYRTAMFNAGLAIEESSYEVARMQAKVRMSNSQGRDMFFAIFSYATALVYQRDYGTASTYFDAAFEQYNGLYESFRPYRIMWYHTRPYWAYYYTANYGALVKLADSVLAQSSGENALEETYYWRALGREGLGDLAGAIEDLEKALALNGKFSLAADQLQRIRAR